MQKRGTTLTNVIAALICIGVLIGVLLQVVSSGRVHDKRIQDRSNLHQISKTFLIYAESQKVGKFPIPGEINRLPFKLDGGYIVCVLGSYPVDEMTDEVIGRGDRDFSVNLSGWLHSYMIGANYYNPNVLISPCDMNALIVAKGNDTVQPAEIPYDYTAVDPANDSYWDPLFSGDISGQGQALGTIEGGVAGACHTSYTNLALCGERLKKHWKNSLSTTVILSTRGPKDGASTGDEFAKSPTMQGCYYGDTWRGTYVIADGSTHFATSMFLDGNTYTPLGTSTPIDDNILKAEFSDFENFDSLGHDDGSASGDIWMALSVGSTETDIVAVWDGLTR